MANDTLINLLAWCKRERERLQMQREMLQSGRFRIFEKDDSDQQRDISNQCRGFSSAVAAGDQRRKASNCGEGPAHGFLLSRFMATNPAALKAHLRDATRHHP